MENLSTKLQHAVTMTLDGVFVLFSLWLAIALRFSDLWPSQIQELSWWYLAAPLVAAPVFVLYGLYRTMLLYISSKAFYTIIKAVTLHVFILAVLTTALAAKTAPFSVIIIYWLVMLILVGGSRVIIRGLLQRFQRNKNSSINVIIYGAGSAGAQLAEALQAGLEYFPVAFIDDKHELHGTEIRGLKVYPTNVLATLLKNYCVKEVLLAIPSAPQSRRRKVMKYLQTFPVDIRTVPALMDIVSGRARVDELREVGIEDILGREPVPPKEHLFAACIRGKSVLVTGAGGSIGSELCRQIISLQPTHLILFDACEFNLYRIEQELRENISANPIMFQNIKIIPVLGTVTNEHKMELVLKTFTVQTVYHAAAYKHVPLVEHNPIEGVKNNVFGTWYAARAAIAAKVETFVLISTDKAVRPTNVMGASKRMAELVIQALAGRHDTTRFCMVRFGNVLGSSGSVVPLFRKQIRMGGPVTLTHPDMIRYFMTIPEAAQLVIQAGSMGEGGDVFVLDMGEPVRIEDMARQMVILSGLSVKDADNPNGDISIQTTSIRPGEKLYEELLLGENVTSTEHPRILRAHEVELPWHQVTELLQKMENACASANAVAVRELLQYAVNGYKPQCGMEDYIWLANHNRDSQDYVINA